MTERDKLEAGMWYDANYDEELRELRARAQGMCLELSRMAPDDPGRAKLIADLLGYEPDHLDVVAPFTCDYGTNIHLGAYVFLNTNCYLMDCAPIRIGSHVFVGPFCGFYTATHPLEHRWRNLGLERALPISVGDNCWFGANVSVMPGVTIGSGCVIAAGAVVTRDVPDNVLVAGVPARIVRTIDQDAPLDQA